MDAPAETSAGGKLFERCWPGRRHWLQLRLRLAGRGGPLALERPDVRHVLLSPVDRGVALRGPAWRQLRFLVGVGAAVGAVTGTVLTFEFGLLWPRFMGRWGEAFGIPFLVEGLFFFTEAIFLGVYLYGWDRISPRAHLLAGVIVAISGAASAVTTSAKRPNQATVQLKRQGDGLAVQVTAPSKPQGAGVLLAITESGLSTKVTRGENSGRTLSHAPVVRTLTPQPEVLKRLMQSTKPQEIPAPAGRAEGAR